MRLIVTLPKPNGISRLLVYLSYLSFLYFSSLSFFLSSVSFSSFNSPHQFDKNRGQQASVSSRRAIWASDSRDTVSVASKVAVFAYALK